ncbi:MAG: hypothetical protein RMJ19_05115 [Gemmatales bacterium]|nr:hypothetical protein [Gemmatales bacterium]MDW8175032.1 hypothetical protein [Gemmatales bacterium]
MIRGATAIWLSLLTAWAAAQEKPTPTLKIVKFPELVKAIESHRGRVVVVDFWANY